MKFRVRRNITCAILDNQEELFLGVNGEVYRYVTVLEELKNVYIETEVPVSYDLPTIYNGDILTYKDDYDNWYIEVVKDNCLFDLYENQEGYALLDYALDEIYIYDINRNPTGLRSGDLGENLKSRVSIIVPPKEGSYDPNDIPDLEESLMEDGFLNISGHPFGVIEELGNADVDITLKVKYNNEKFVVVIDNGYAEWIKDGKKFQLQF